MPNKPSFNPEVLDHLMTALGKDIPVKSIRKNEFPGLLVKVWSPAYIILNLYCLIISRLNRGPSLYKKLYCRFV